MWLKSTECHQKKKSYNQSLKEYRDMYLMENALKKKEALLQVKDAEIQTISTGISMLEINRIKKML